jgi:hypothetical protein
MNSNLYKNDAKLVSGKGGQTAAVKVDKLVREIQNLAVSCINFVRAFKLGLRAKR